MAIDQFPNERSLPMNGELGRKESNLNLKDLR